MNEPVKVSCVSYLNSLPFVYGLNNHAVKSRIGLSLDNPGKCAGKLISGEANIGLVPVASIPLIHNAQVISEFCIGADGPVSSVMLFSDVPMENIESILLDYQSMTSVNLVQVLARELWRITPAWVDSTEGYEEHIGGSTAGVVIGDRAMIMKDRFRYAFDLSGEWKKLTGLPFVFACWVSNINLPESFLKDFNLALKFGIEHTDHALKDLLPDVFLYDDALFYIRNRIDYRFDSGKKKAMKSFLEKMALNEPLQLHG
jgi:chorismate dehydratase